MNTTHILAQLPSPDRQQLFVIYGILLVVVIVGGAAIMLIRRKYREPEVGGHAADVGFSLSDLREMRDRGEISAEEYERTRAKIVTKIRATLGTPQVPNTATKGQPPNSGKNEKPL